MRRVSGIIAWLSTVMLACSSGTSGTGGTSSCEIGSERCECYPNGTCNGSLSCMSNRCVDRGAAGNSGVGGKSAATGSGVGNGTAIGGTAIGGGSNGGNANGGASNPANGGNANGGTAIGGTAIGGASNGGNAIGGGSNGGNANGDTAIGGTAIGGGSNGGNANGGASNPANGGNANGGNANGGNANGGTAIGGASNGGAATGGAATGGSTGTAGAAACTPPADGSCTVPGCGCNSWEVCGPDTTTKKMRCASSWHTVAGNRCSEPWDCALGLGCLEGVCSPYCTSSDQCPSFGTPNKCIQRTWTDHTPIPGVGICERACDPLSPQSPRLGFAPCPSEFRCEATPDGYSYCAPPGTRAERDFCTESPNCRPGLVCFFAARICTRACYTNADCPAGPCNSFDPPRFSGTLEVGYCL